MLCDKCYRVSVTKKPKRIINFRLVADLALIVQSRAITHSALAQYAFPMKRSENLVEM